MPITQSAKKELRKSASKRVFNLRRSRDMKDVVRNIRKLVSAKNVKEAEALLPEAYKKIDKAAKRGVIKKNTAARKKSRLAASIKRSSQ